MYKNVGKTIKVISAVFGWLFFTVGAIMFLVFIPEDRTLEIAWASLGGAVVMLISSFVMYGFGQLIEDVHVLRGEKEQTGTETETPSL